MQYRWYGALTVLYKADNDLRGNIYYQFTQPAEEHSFAPESMGIIEDINLPKLSVSQNLV